MENSNTAKTEDGDSAGAQTKSSGRDELVVLRAGDGAEHRASRATLEQCEYFQVKLARWGREVIELDVNNESLRAILTLLRYGPRALPILDEPASVMVLKDADYLGVPTGLTAHLAARNQNDDLAISQESAKRITEWERGVIGVSTCDRCHQHSVRAVWSCTGCGTRIGSSTTRSSSSAHISALGLRVGCCKNCGPEYMASHLRCMLCRA